MIEFFLSDGMAPFAFSLVLFIGLLALELAAALLGWSFLGSQEADADFDIDVLESPEPSAEIDGAPDGFGDAEAFDADGVDGADAPASAGTGAIASTLAWLGIGRVPLIIWIAGALVGFGLAGYALQILSLALVGTQLPASLAALLALAPGALFAGRFATLVARIAPKLETTAVSRRRFGGAVGVVAQGSATRGRPAQARFKDRHGELHYVLVEPFEDHETLSQGEEIILLRARRGEVRDGRILKAIRLDAARDPVL